jgi:DNA-binding NtrC family response regulator
MSKILIIDDDDFLRKSYAAALKQQNFEVVELADGCKAIQIINAEAPDIVLTDILMPDCDGIEVISRIREHNKAINIIAMSGGGRIDSAFYLDMATALGVVAVFEKPFSLNKLLETLKSILDSD